MAFPRLVIPCLLLRTIQSIVHSRHIQSQVSTQCRPRECRDTSEDSKALQEEVSLSVTPFLVGLFVLCMCGMLVLLYFFFSYLGKKLIKVSPAHVFIQRFISVYVIIGLFVLASTTAVYQCLEPIVRRIPIGANKYSTIAVFLWLSIKPLHFIGYPALIGGFSKSM